MGWIVTLRKGKSLDPDIIETDFWPYSAEHFSPRRDLASSGKEVEGTRVMLEGVLDKLPNENVGLTKVS